MFAVNIHSLTFSKVLFSAMVFVIATNCFVKLNFLFLYHLNVVCYQACLVVSRETFFHVCVIYN